MKSVSLSLTMLLLVAIIHSPDVNATTVPSESSNSVATNIPNQIKNLNQISSLPSTSNHNNTTYQFSSGDFLLDLFFLFIYFMLFLQFCLDYNLPITKKEY